MKETCETCRFAIVPEKQSRIPHFTCQRYPPVEAHRWDEDTNDWAYAWEWPIVNMTGWCGEWQLDTVNYPIDAAEKHG